MLSTFYNIDKSSHFVHASIYHSQAHAVINTVVISKLKQWWLTAIYEEYELTVWFDGGVVEDADGNTTPNPKSKKVFSLKSISKRTPTHIKGTELDGKQFEIRTVQPFDYMIRKIY